MEWEQKFNQKAIEVALDDDESELDFSDLFEAIPKMKHYISALINGEASYDHFLVEVERTKASLIEEEVIMADKKLSEKFQSLANLFKYLENSGYSEGYEIIDNGNGIEIKKELHKWLQDGLKGKRLIKELEAQEVRVSPYDKAGYFEEWV
ncbi:MULTISPECIES: hypothetical protein [Cyanophyceae]|uniref:hypothetical protein n=1 Tax=Cyanophyceae TaxID=3028117 RepID=UPI0016889246|nr:hypothetical protein [Trichocoleus sp. FACHB-69]MBD1935617.1 hypothetical protein [Trichocoleus sp. FACHB-69]